MCYSHRGVSFFSERVTINLLSLEMGFAVYTVDDRVGEGVRFLKVKKTNIMR